MKAEGGLRAVDMGRHLGLTLQALQIPGVFLPHPTAFFLELVQYRLQFLGEFRP